MADTQIPTSSAALAAEIVVDGCLRMIRGDVAGRTPAPPAQLTDDERALLGLEPGGNTLFYPAGQEGVFVDMHGSACDVWFFGDDVRAATKLLHERLAKAFPAAQQMDDVAHPTDPEMRARAYRIELPGMKLATISTSFSDVRGRTMFKARVLAQRRLA
ncbi:MAG: hypothetical protein K2P58_00305 [Hyphomonadaceae bacterium]|nr:hypothetical protein [Hyphomonadaceae bacterium]